MEVDASNEGIAAVLSQRSKKDGKIHPCAFLSRKELLAVKIALKEWRHWLEGSQLPFTV